MAKACSIRVEHSSNIGPQFKTTQTTCIPSLSAEDTRHLPASSVKPVLTPLQPIKLLRSLFLFLRYLVLPWSETILIFLQETISLKIKEEQEARSMFDNLIQNKNYDFFFQLAKTRHKNVKKNRICTIIENEEGKIMIYPYLKMKALDKDCALSIYISANKQKIAKVVICAQTIEKDVENFCKNLSIDIVLLDQYDCYQYLFKEYDFFPQQTHTPSSSSKHKQIFGYAFNRSRTKGYAISAMLLLAISFFIRQNLYYCIVATILLLFALLSTLQSSNTRENLKKI